MPEWLQPTYVHCYRLRCVSPGILVLILLAIMLPISGTAVAKVTGPCSNCHTMHYSQNNSILPEWDEGGPHQALLTTDCVGCHTGINSGNADWDTPFVTDANQPTYGDTGTEGDTLAGGSFYWVASDSSAGHDVAGLTTSGPATPPGFEDGRTAADDSSPGSDWGENKLTCAGTYGCHGTHYESSQTRAIHGAHHGNLGGARTSPGYSPAAGYRFLVGIEGYEDSDWEFQPDAGNHNQYKGLNSPETTDTSTISSLCARCHGQYHSNVTDSVSGASPWLRHPTDYDMSNTGEYANYGGSGNAYVPAVPVASETVTTVKSNVEFNNDTIVTCVTCHRAHGSPYYKAMRWNYSGSVNGGLCTECHSSKK